MLKSEDNVRLTRTGPGTVMGDLLRLYWVPVLLSSELPSDGCPPVRVKVLGEELVAVRDANGRLGLLQERCAHRCASLFFGRNEGEHSPDGQVGLRCIYHGWKYDLDGRCIDMPSEPRTSRFKEHIRLKAYPAHERGGVVWAYLGPPESRPPLPELEWAVVPEDQRFVSRRHQRSNFMQAMEGGIDSSHVSFLHSDARLWIQDWTDGHAGSLRGFLLEDSAPRFFIEPTEYGVLIGARRETRDGEYYWRVTQWLMPWYTLIPRDGDAPIGGHAWVPIDDENCWAWSVNYHPDRRLRNSEVEYFRGGGGIHAECVPGTFEPVRTADNDYLIDRLLQSTVSWSGIKGIAMEDVAMQESMGPIVDREQEHLGSSDAAVVVVRNRLLGEAKALEESNVMPSGRDSRFHRVRSMSTVLPKSVSWVEATAESRKASGEYYTTVGI